MATIARSACLVLYLFGSCLGIASALRGLSSSSAGDPTSGEGAVSSQRLPFAWNLVAHVPHEGGTKLRRVLEELAAMRNQTLQLCYSTLQCELTQQELQPQIDRREEHWMSFDKFFTSPKNQIIFGHGVTMNFAQHWGLPQDGVARVVTVRDPILHLVSDFKHRRRGHEPGMPGSFEEWVMNGRLGETARHFMSWYLPQFNASLPKTEIEKRVEEALGRESTLTLLMDEEYQPSVRRLAKFLGASAAEEEQLVLRSLKPDGRRLDDYVFSMHKKAWDQFIHEIKPLQLVHDYVVSHVSAESPPGVSVKEKSAKSRQPAISEEGDRVTVAVPGAALWEEP